MVTLLNQCAPEERARLVERVIDEFELDIEPTGESAADGANGSPIPPRVH